MNLSRITVITPPDKYFNMNLGYLLIHPSEELQRQFQAILSSVEEDVNVFIYDEDVANIDWLLSVAHQTDMILIDVDNCSEMTTKFVSFLLTHPGAFYITNNEDTPYNLISKNRIFNLDWLTEPIDDIDEEDDEFTSE